MAVATMAAAKPMSWPCQVHGHGLGEFTARSMVQLMDQELACGWPDQSQSWPAIACGWPCQNMPGHPWVAICHPWAKLPPLVFDVVIVIVVVLTVSALEASVRHPSKREECGPRGL